MTTIKVTQENIDNGLASIFFSANENEGELIYAGQCPVARALQNQFPFLSETKVFDDKFVFRQGEKQLEMNLPKSVGVFVRKFNKRKPLMPFAFRIDNQAIMNLCS